MWTLYRPALLKWEVIVKAKLLISIPTHTCGHKLWVVTEKMRYKLWKWASSEGCLGSPLLISVVHGGFRAELLLLYIKWSQMRWFGHRTRKPLKASVRWDFFWACPSGRRPQGIPKTCLGSLEHLVLPSKRARRGCKRKKLTASWPEHYQEQSRYHLNYSP